MKRTLTALLMAFGLGSLFLATPVSAQNNPSRADIPFSFLVGNTRLAAGEYTFSQGGADPALFTIRNLKGGAIFTLLAARVKGAPAKPSVTFVRAGSEWVLTKVCPPNDPMGFAAPNQHNEHHVPVAAMVSVGLR